ncbi:hypothetical protein D3C81_07140 [compost metagenome]
MVYDKCMDILRKDAKIRMDIANLDIIRKALSMIDEQCLQLSLFEVEKLWFIRNDWHGWDNIPVTRDNVKRLMAFVTRGIMSSKELQKYYDKFNADKELTEFNYGMTKCCRCDAVDLDSNMLWVEEDGYVCKKHY